MSCPEAKRRFPLGRRHTSLPRGSSLATNVPLESSAKTTRLPAESTAGLSYLGRVVTPCASPNPLSRCQTAFPTGSKATSTVPAVGPRPKSRPEHGTPGLHQDQTDQATAPDGPGG